MRTKITKHDIDIIDKNLIDKTDENIANTHDRLMENFNNNLDAKTDTFKNNIGDMDKVDEIKGVTDGETDGIDGEMGGGMDKIDGGKDSKINLKAEKKGRFKNSNFFKTFYASLVLLLVATLVIGIIYPFSVTLAAQTLFPYQANGSQITVTLKDGTTRVFGSQLIGQSYESPQYLFGRVNGGVPSNVAVESEEYKQLIESRIEERKQKLIAIGYTDTEKIPYELLSESGSGLDPHISVETAYFQIDQVVAARKALGWKLLLKNGTCTPVKPGDVLSLGEDEQLVDYNYDFVKSAIDRFTEGRFLYVFGQKRVTVLCVNLFLDGLI